MVNMPYNSADHAVDCIAHKLILKNASINNKHSQVLVNCQKQGTFTQAKDIGGLQEFRYLSDFVKPNNTDKFIKHLITEMSEKFFPKDKAANDGDSNKSERDSNVQSQSKLLLHGERSNRPIKLNVVDMNRINRCTTTDGSWRREWDAGKTPAHSFVKRPSCSEENGARQTRYSSVRLK